jgi:hypothetical protein
MILTILLTALVATFMMSAFSFLISEGFRKIYKEPLLLQYLITHSRFKVYGTAKKITSWIIHYFIGVIFVMIYFLLWRTKLFAIDWISGLIFGLVIGAIGITGWEIMHTITGYPPSIDVKGFHLQQFFAHIIFGLTTIIAFQILI